MSEGRVHRDHGLVGNGRILALIAPGGGVEWLCLPRFDGDALFAGLLDPERGGTWRISPCAAHTSRQRYLPGSRVLQTTFTTPEGRVQVTDFCPTARIGEPPAAELVRLIEPLDGPVRVQVQFRPRLEGGQGAARLRPELARLWVTDEVQLGVSQAGGVIARGEPLRLTEPLVLVLSHGAPQVPPVRAAAEAALRVTLAADRLHGAGLPRAIQRDLLTLLSLCYRPTGAIIAAACPRVLEAPGNPRAADARSAWIRDGCFTAEILARLGALAPARAFLDFLAAQAADPPPPRYGIGGEWAPPEQILPHPADFAGPGPGRPDPPPAIPVQPERFGQIVWLAERLEQLGGGSLPDAGWLSGLVDQALAVADAPGRWGAGDRPGRSTCSQVWCWVAAERGARLARRWGDLERAARWQAAADALHARILSAAQRVGFFARTLEGEEVDVSSLQIAQLGLVGPRDPLLIATVRRCEQTLLAGGWMRRALADDARGETPSAFSRCTLWWVEALATIGERAAARAALARFEAFANPHGLYAEDVDPMTGQPLGNFPQASTHLALASARLALG